MEIRFATPSDLDSLLDLLRANHADNVPDEEKKFGFVTTQITKEQLIDLIEQENGVTVAVDGGRVVSFALAGAWEYWKPWPLFSYMIEILETFQHDGVTMTTENCYQYGPICIDKDYRSTGLFKKCSTSLSPAWPTAFPTWLRLSIRSTRARMRPTSARAAWSKPASSTGTTTTTG